MRTPLIALSAAATLTLGACVDTVTGDPNRTANSAMIGAGIGAAAGAILGEGSRADEIAAGAAIGGLIGGGIGANLDRQAQELRDSLGDGRIGIVNTGSELVVTMPQDVLFATGSAQLSGALQSDLRVLSRSINAYPNTTVSVIGHTDNVGTAEFNQELSQARAASVAQVLIGSGVTPSRVRSIGRGEAQPIATNNTAQGRQQNRRVEIVIRPTPRT
jgi:outer membrane protein OmpA-like peptidoglycan-associated protein